MTIDDPASSSDDDSDSGGAQQSPKDRQSPNDRQLSEVSSASRRRDQSSVLRFAGLGIELATATLVFAGIGYLIDWWLQVDKSYGTAAGTLVGFIIGMIRFIQQALQGTRGSS